MNCRLNRDEREALFNAFLSVRQCQLAQHRQISVNKLIEELSMVALAQFDAELRFRARAARGSVEAGLRLLDKLDADPSS